MINMAFMPLYMWEMWDVTPVTHTRTVESSAVFCLSRIRNCTPCTSNKNCADAYVVRVRPFRNDKNAFYRTWDRHRTESRRSCCICSKEQEKAGSIISKSILMWYPRKISTTLFKPQSVTLPVNNQHYRLCRHESLAWSLGAAGSPGAPIKIKLKLTVILSKLSFNQ